MFVRPLYFDSDGFFVLPVSFVEFAKKTRHNRFAVKNVGFFACQYHAPGFLVILLEFLGILSRGDCGRRDAPPFLIVFPVYWNSPRGIFSIIHANFADSY